MEEHHCKMNRLNRVNRLLRLLEESHKKVKMQSYTYIEIPERRPVIREDGSADYYEMNFVTPVNEGDWLGEKVPAQEGIDGKDVLGNSFPAQRGDDDEDLL